MNINQTLKGAVAEYIQHVSGVKSEATQALEKIAFTYFEQYFKDKNLLSEITTKDCDFFQSFLLKSQKASSVNRFFAVYNHFFQKCIEWGYFDHSPTRFLKKKREAVPIRVLWNDEEIKDIKSILGTSNWLYDVIDFLSNNGGIRPDELGKIRVKDVNYSTGVAVIECKKNSGVFRLALINKVGLSIMKRLSEGKSQNDMIFQSEKGNPVSTNTMNTKLRRIQKECGFERKPIYSLRHTYATKLCDKNVNLEKVRLILGHQKIQTTLKYLRIDILGLKDVIDSVS